VRAAGDENLGETREVWGAEHVADEAGEVGVCCAGVEGEGDLGGWSGVGREVEAGLGLVVEVVPAVVPGLGVRIGIALVGAT
jgi:hypothetical protein